MHTEAYFVPQATVDAIAATKPPATGRVRRHHQHAAPRIRRPRRQPEAGEAESDLFILPGYRFQVADALVTNFPCPKSTLLMLVSPCRRGRHPPRLRPRHRRQRYRFFSYGDAMFLTRNPA